ncbi:MAG TPA: BrnT family toxin [Pyrinomonadaceae bacterium]
MRFEWDDAKAAANLRKHGVSFDEAAEVFSDPYALESEDAEHSYGELRVDAVGYSATRMLFVIFTLRRGDVIRIISARKPTPSEIRMYEEQKR